MAAARVVGRWQMAPGGGTDPAHPPLDLGATRPLEDLEGTPPCRPPEPFLGGQCVGGLPEEVMQAISNIAWVCWCPHKTSRPTKRPVPLLQCHCSSSAATPGSGGGKEPGRSRAYCVFGLQVVISTHRKRVVLHNKGSCGD
ncbi:unnamed protein product [Merluccius merluccius]